MGQDIIKDWENTTQNRVNWESLVREVMPFLNDKFMNGVVNYANSFNVNELLPINLMIISGINDLSKIIFVEEEIESRTYRINITRDEIMNLNLHGVDTVVMVESAVKDIIIDEINEKIENGQIVYVNRLVESIALITEGTSPPLVTIRSNIKFE